MNKLKDIIDILGMEPLVEEGGLWAKTICSEDILPGGAIDAYPKERPLYGAIYYLLTPDTFSRMHRLTSNEIWLHHSGPAVRLLLIHPDGKSEIRLLGQDLAKGERPQILVPRGTWQGAAMDPVSSGGFDSEDGEIYSFMSTTMTPEYLDSDYETATFDELKPYVDEKNLDLLKLLTCE